MDMKRVYLAFLIAMVFTLVAVTSGCSSNDTTGYKEFIVSEGLASFSFEYPAFCSEPRIDRSLEPQSTVVDTIGVIQPRVNGTVLLVISIFQVNDTYPNAQAMLEDNLSSFEGLQDFHLLERSLVTIAEIQGEQIIFSYSRYPSPTEFETETWTDYEAYFDSEGLIWRVWMLADEYAAAERARDDFEHVLETFQILD
jgi:hypothetical protein